jgi:hypothetical protein
MKLGQKKTRSKLRAFTYLYQLPLHISAIFGFFGQFRSLLSIFGYPRRLHPTIADYLSSFGDLRLFLTVFSLPLNVSAYMARHSD